MKFTNGKYDPDQNILHLTGPGVPKHGNGVGE